MNLLNKVENVLAKFRAHKQIMGNLEIKKSQDCYPEQYDILCYGIYTGYIRLRYGVVSICFAPAGAKEYATTVLYSEKVGNKHVNEFTSNSKRKEIIDKAKRLVSECIYFDMIS